MNELIAKLETQLAGLLTEQEAALNSADAEGCSAEDKAKHIAKFDELDVKVKETRASLSRAKSVTAHRTEFDTNRTLPTTPAIVQQPAHGPLNPPARPRVSATPRRHGALRAFKGAQAEERAYQAGCWVAACFYNHAPSASRLEEFGIQRQATLSTINNSQAAYFVPDVLTTTVIELQEQYGVIRRLADVEPMSSETWKGPRWTTNMTAYWVSQGNAPTQSEPGWDLIELVAKDLAAYGKMTRQLNEDAIVDLGDKWAMAAAVAFSFAEDNAAFNGDGTSSYGGITGLLVKIIDAANAASLFTATGHTTLGALTISDFASVVGKFPSYPGAMPSWLCHKEVWAASMLPLQMAAGGATPRDIQQGGKPEFLGYPVEWVATMPKAAAVTTGVTGILFADLKLSTKFGDRRVRTLEVGMINDDLIKQLMTLFAASRVDIVNHTIRDPKVSTSAGPVIGLKLG